MSNAHGQFPNHAGSRHRRGATTRTVARLAVGLAVGLTSPTLSAQGAFERARQQYATLTSYADVGTVIVESGVPGAPVQVERFTLRTRFRRPRAFFFEFRSTTPDGDHLAIWCEGDGHDFESWWKATGVHEVYRNGTGVNAFLAATQPSHGSAVQIIALLLPQVEFKAGLADFAPARVIPDTIGGRPLLRATGVVQGHFGAARPRTVWFDAVTGLVWRIVDDTPQGSVAGVTDRITMTFTPQANRVLTEPFRFRIPGQP